MGAEKRVRTESCKERRGALIAEEMREHVCRRKRGEAKAREQEWMTREQVQRLKDFGRKRGPMSDECLQEAAPALAVAAENRLNIAEVWVESDGSAVVEGVRDWRPRVEPLTADVLQRRP